jgi:hypothetical protein
MTRENIIKMAQEAGLIRAGEHYTEPARWGISVITHFAKLVAAAEREACAKVCETFYNHEAKDCAAAIRARGEQ